MTGLLIVAQQDGAPAVLDDRQHRGRRRRRCPRRLRRAPTIGFCRSAVLVQQPETLCTGLAAVPEQLRRLGIGLAGVDPVDLVLQVAVGLKEVQPAVEIGVEKQYREGQGPARIRPEALEHGLVDERSLGRPA